MQNDRVIHENGNLINEILTLPNIWKIDGLDTTYVLSY